MGSEKLVCRHGTSVRVQTHLLVSMRKSDNSLMLRDAYVFV